MIDFAFSAAAPASGAYASDPISSANFCVTGAPPTIILKPDNPLSLIASTVFFNAGRVVVRSAEHATSLTFLLFLMASINLLGRLIDANINHIKTGAADHHADKVFADIMKVAFNRAYNAGTQRC